MTPSEAGDPPRADTVDDRATSAEETHSPSLLARLFGWREESASRAEPARDIEGGHNSRDMASKLADMVRKRAADVAIPRADIIGVPDDIEPAKLIGVFRDTAMTRLPVYHDTMDDPLGFIHLKDLALRHGFGPEQVAFDLKDLLRPMLYVPPSMPLFILLRKMQRERCHMALVIDEYGGVDGLITFEDLVEQIVGEIDDEHDTEDAALWRNEGNGVWLVEARAALDDFCKAARINLALEHQEEEVDTLGGLVFLLTGHVPERGEEVRHPAGHVFEVIDADSRRINRLRIRLVQGSRLDRAAE